MKAELLQDNGNRRRVPIGRLLTIGRRGNHDIDLNDELVSRSHALIRLQHDRDYYLIDLASSNGTFVNNQLRSVPTKLKSGDKIAIGNTEFTFLTGAVPALSNRSHKTDPTLRHFLPVTVAVLVCDVRNYTSLSERIPANELSPFLAEWFVATGALIQGHEGNIEKIRGDSVMAYWIKNDDSSLDYVRNSVTVATDIVDAARDFDVRFADQYPGQHFCVGCGLHAGEAILGNIGSDARRDFTTTGDCINIAFRIESLCRVLQKDILVSKDIVDLAADRWHFESLGPQPIKGKQDSFDIFALSGVR